jgi:hypothetical protein
MYSIFLLYFCIVNLFRGAETMLKTGGIPEKPNE